MTAAGYGSRMPSNLRTEQIERVVQVTFAGRVFTFTVERRGALDFWTVSTPGHTPFASPISASGHEERIFFEQMAAQVWEILRDEQHPRI